MPGPMPPLARESREGIMPIMRPVRMQLTSPYDVMQSRSLPCLRLSIRGGQSQQRSPDLKTGCWPQAIAPHTRAGASRGVMLREYQICISSGSISGTPCLQRGHSSGSQLCIARCARAS